MAALKTRDFQLIGALPAAESAIDGLLRLKCAELKTAKELLKDPDYAEVYHENAKPECDSAVRLQEIRIALEIAE